MRSALKPNLVRVVANVLILAMAIVAPASANATTIEQFDAGGINVRFRLP